MKLKVMTIIGLLGLTGALGWSGVKTSRAQGNIKSETLTIDSRQFTRGSGAGFAVAGDGLTMADEAVTAVYTSDIIEAPIPFNAVVPEQLVNVPEGASAYRCGCGPKKRVGNGVSGTHYGHILIFMKMRVMLGRPI